MLYCAVETSSSAIAEKPVLGGWWVMAWVRQYSAPNVVGARKLRALIFYTINPLLYDKRSLCVFSPSLGGLGTTYAVQLRLIGKPTVDFLLIELFSLGARVQALRANIDWKSPLLKGWVMG